MAGVAVIGGGIAGLTAGYYLQKSGVPFTLMEASGHTGGKVRSRQQEGYLLEFGPHTLQGRHEVLEEVIEELALAKRLQVAAPQARRRYIVRGRRPVAVPEGILSFLKTPLLSARAKLRLLREPFSPDPDDEHESVASFIRRRLGPEVLSYAVDPFVAGVYAGDPARLSMQHAFPRIHALEREAGGLFKGLFEATVRPASRRIPRRSPFSFEGGMQTLPDALAASVSDRIRLDTHAEAIAPVEGMWKITTRDSEQLFDAVVLTVPLHAMPLELSPAPDVAYPPVAVAALAYPRAHIAHALDGFGLLVPSAERDYHILGALFTSTLFPERAPPGHALLTSFIGGARAPELAAAPDNELYNAVHEDLRRLLGITGAPVFRARHTWPHAIPQYHLRYDKVLARLDALEAAHTGLYFAGNYRGGVALGDAMKSGRDAVMRYLRHARRGTA